MADGEETGMNREQHEEQRRMVRRAVDREQQREVYGLRVKVDPELPPNVIVVPAPPVKVGTEREGWRARLAMVETILADALTGDDAMDEIDRPVEPDAVREALDIVRGMIDGVQPDEPQGVDWASPGVERSAFCVGCQRAHRPPVAVTLSDPCPLEVTSCES